MFDFRYHALSLVAVFIALALGLLLGVAIGDSGLVSSAERDIRSGLRSDVRKANERADDAESARKKAEREVDAAYPLLVGGQLANRSVGLVFLGDGSQDLSDDVKAALEDTGATRVNVATVKEPVDLKALAGAAKGTRYAELLGPDGKPDLDLVEAFGFRMAAQYVLPGKLIDRARDDLFDRLAGSLKPLQGVVLVRNRGDIPKDQQAVADRFEAGFARGLRATGIPVAGAERSSTSPSQVGWYEDHSLSSVDDTERTIGRAALVFVLAGAHGSFGQKSSADGLLPDIGSTTSP